MLASLGGTLLGLVIGLRHAFEPDHLTAVSTLVVETRNPRHGAMLGALWGLGHTAALVAVGGMLVITGAVLPTRLAAGFELLVAVMLIGLGCRSIVRAIREGTRGPTHTHAHGERQHHHAGPAAHVHARGRTLALRPLLVGLIHGMAGSGAITALVLAELPTTATRVLYIAMFGAGSIIGMAVASAVAGASLGALVATPRARRGLGFVTGLLSIAVGMVWGVPQLLALT